MYETCLYSSDHRKIIISFILFYCVVISSSLVKKTLGIYPFVSKLILSKSPQTIEKGEQFRYPTYLLDFDFNIVYNKLNFFARKTTSIIHYSSAVGDFIIHYKNPFLMNDEY